MGLFAAVGASRMQRMGAMFPLATTLDPVERMAFAVSLGISATLILRLWWVHRHDRFIRKLFWSVVLLVPVIGWVCYGGWYAPLPRNTVFASRRMYGDAGGPRV